MRRVIFLTLVGGVGFATLLALGIWQMQRLAWKQSILDTIESRIAAAPVALPNAPSASADSYRAVTVAGEIEPKELHVFWVTERAGAGYRVISSFVTRSGRRILLDRGFIRSADKASERPAGPAEITGNLLWPQEGDWTTPPPEVDSNILYTRDLAYMADQLNTEPLLVVAREGTRVPTPLPVTTEGIPNNHLQYAITWFLLALIWAVMTVTFLLRTRAKT
ncbi:SURF1 family protein [Tritonibacter horizontis]|uniref:SURF1 family protein n=1 Tax=Tritonibacter horizontis TaxID=1768241 RepID=UPI000833F296|nr:SURF1 family protein [Tritonibacter horizontis]